MTETTGITETTATIAATTATTIAGTDGANVRITRRSEEHTSELQSQSNLVCRLLLEKKKKNTDDTTIPLKPSYPNIHSHNSPPFKTVLHSLVDHCSAHQFAQHTSSPTHHYYNVT